MSLNPRITELAGNKVRLDWTPDLACQGYRLYVDGVAVSRTFKPEASSTTFQKPDSGSHRYGVQKMDVVDALEEVAFPAPTTPPPSAWTSRSYLRWRGAGLPPSHVADYDLVMLDDPSAAPGQSPAKKVLRYSNAFALADVDDGRFAVTKAQARANGWVLKDASGAELVMTYYPQFLAADVGVRGYQDAWCDAWLPKLRSAGVEGVFIDDGGRNFAPTSANGVPATPAKYPVADVREAAMVSFHKRIAERLQAEGFYVCSSAGGYTSGDPRSDTGEIDALYWEKLCAAKPYPNAIFLEYWQCHSNIPGYIRKQGTTSWVLNWDGWQDALRRGLALDVDWLGMCDSEDRAHGVYCYASMLLEWQGRGSYVWAPYASDPWITPPGQPKGTKRKNGNRWERDFDRGLVWVDPVAGTSSLP